VSFNSVTVKALDYTRFNNIVDSVHWRGIVNTALNSPIVVTGGELVTTDKLPPRHKELWLADTVTAVATVLSVTGVLTTGDYRNNTPPSNWCGANRRLQ
jgi:hypothetical protein